MKIDALGGIGLILILGAIAFMSTRCTVVPPDAPPRPVPTVDVLPPDPEPPPGVDWCEAACANLRKLGCDWADPTPGDDGLLGTDDDGTCESVCRVAEQEPETTMRPGCVSWAESCAAAEECTR